MFYAHFIIYIYILNLIRKYLFKENYKSLFLWKQKLYNKEKIIEDFKICNE